MALNRHFSKEDIQRVQRHVKRWSVSLTIRQMKIKTKLRYQFTQVRMAIIKKSQTNIDWREVMKKRVHYWWEC